MSSRQSPLPPPPQSPLIHLGTDRLKTQLELEENLRTTSEELLEVYKNSRQWKQVTQMAQTLSFNAERITCIQDCLSSFNVFELPPPEPEPPLLLSSPASEQTKLPIIPNPSGNDSTMVEDPYDEFISVKPAGGNRNTFDIPCWEIKSKKHTGGETVLRTSNDVTLLLSNIFKRGDSHSPSLPKDGVADSPDAIRDIIMTCLDSDSVEDKELLLIQSFLTPSVNSFSSLLLDSEKLCKVIEEEVEDDQPSFTPLDESPNDSNSKNESQMEFTSNPDETHEPIKSTLSEPQSDSQTDSCTTGSSEQYKTAPESFGQSDSHNDDPQSNSDIENSMKPEPPAPDAAELPSEHEVNKDSPETIIDSGDTIHASIEGEDSNKPEDSISREETHIDKPIEEDVVSTKEKDDEDGDKSPAVAEAGPVVQTQVGTTSIPVAEADPVVQTQVGTTSIPVAEADPVVKTQVGTTSIPVAEADPVVQTQVGTTSIPVAEADPVVQTQVGTSIPVAEADPVVQTQVGTTSIPVAEADPVVQTQVGTTSIPVAEADPVVQTQVGTTSIPVAESISDTPPSQSDDDTRPKQSPSKHGIKITNASQMFIQFQSIKEIEDSSEPSETPPLPLFSDTDDVTDTPTDNFTDTPTDLTSSDVFSRSGEISEDVDSGEKKKNEASVTNDNQPMGNSTFFVESNTCSAKSQDSPKQMRNKSHSVFYPRSSPSPPPDQDKAKLRSRIKRSFKRTNKIKKEVSTTEEPQVSLMAPKLATEWDPTCILEELYSDCRPVQSSAGADSCRYSGYLDKLPVNQSKPAVMKGWKHRYFRVTRGSLFYYEDNKNQKAISFVRLTDAKITLHIDSLKVEIVEKNGNFIFLRAETKADAIAFHRALQLECVHPTLTHRLSLSPSRTTPTIIMDLGSCSVRAGLISDDNDYPQLFFPNVCALANDKVIACGHDSLLPSTRGISKLVYPRRHRSRMDSTISIRECFTAIVEHICKKLDVKPETCNMLASVSPIMPEMEQQILAEVVLETLGFQGLLIQEQTTLALYSYNCTTGISISVGDSISVVPIIDGYKVEGADQHIPLGGINISENLSKLASSKDIRYFSDTEMYIIRHVKESLCFVSQEYFLDSDKCDDAPHEYMRAIDVDRFQLPDHKKVIALDLSLFKAPEGLFQPAIWGKDVSGIHEMIHRSIDQCPIDMKRDMCRHIYLSGGTTLMTGFPERLKSELSKLFPRMEIVVNTDENRYHAAYLGACILASLNTFQKSLVTQDDWIAEGFDAFKRNTS